MATMQGEAATRLGALASAVPARLAAALVGAGFVPYRSTDEAAASLSGVPGVYVMHAWVFVFAGAAADIRAAVGELAARRSFGVCHAREFPAGDGSLAKSECYTDLGVRLGGAALIDIGRRKRLD
jgi:hypothetical protein